MAKALELANANLKQYTNKLLELREHTIFRILNEIPEAKLNGDRLHRLPGNVNVSFKGIDAKGLVLMLDMKNIAVSSGSACTAGQSSPSHVLKAIGLDDNTARNSIRITYGECNSIEDADHIINNIKEIIKIIKH